MRWIKILFLITALILALIMAQDTHSQYVHHSLRAVDINYWDIDITTRTGYSTRIKATEQNPYPFCFSAGATMLFDQHRCQYDKKNCNKITNSSFLSATPAGQKLPVSRIDVDVGGNAVASLSYLLETGYTEHKNCNYNHLDSYAKDFNSQAVQVIQQYNMSKNFEQQWKRHKDYAPYLERFYRSQWNKTLQRINPNLTDEQTQNLLGRTDNKQEFMASVLLNENCVKNLRKENRFKIVFKPFEDIQKSADTINLLLRNNKPVLVNFCVNAKTNNECIGNNKHAAVIVASAKATHRGTGDERTIYWIVNSWSETWQEKNSDGWIFADSFLESIFAELVWLDKK